MMEYLNVVAIIVAGLMVGSELAIAAFVHPTLDRLPDNVHLPAASALARVLGRFMPFWYILVFLLTLAEVDEEITFDIVDAHRLIANLTIQGDRLSRQFRKSLETLLKIQAERAEREHCDLNEAAALLE
jgi:hypothetical protein